MKDSQVILIADKKGRVKLPDAKEGDIYIYDSEKFNERLTRGIAVIGTSADINAFTGNRFGSMERQSFKGVTNITDPGGRFPEDGNLDD